jgi:hypothetical protein
MSSSFREANTVIIGRFRDRADRLRKSARWVLCWIVILLIVGMAVFLVAGEIIRQELLGAQTSAILDLAEKQLLQNATDATAEIVRLKAEVAGTTDSEISKLQSIATSLQVVAQLNKETSERPATNSAQTSFLISTIAVRAGTIVLLLFLVQILVPLYRYRTRLAVFYEKALGCYSVMVVCIGVQPMQPAESWAADFLLTAGTGPDFRKPIANSARLNGPDNELSALREECRIFFGAC